MKSVRTMDNKISNAIVTRNLQLNREFEIVVNDGPSASNPDRPYQLWSNICEPPCPPGCSCVSQEPVRSTHLSLSLSEVNTFGEEFQANYLTGPSRKRRLEVEKLYESLNEIKRAKNFSPDDILRQIPNIACQGMPQEAERGARRKNESAGEIFREQNAVPQTFRSTRSSTLRNQSGQTCDQNAESSSANIKGAIPKETMP